MLSLDDIIKGVGSELREVRGASEGCSVKRVVIDSRDVTPGAMFVALRGERSDGHEYITSAIEQGAVAVIAERAPEVPIVAATAALLLVGDSLAALQALAAYWRSQHAAEVIGITGSVGKTTTKELTAAVLSRRSEVLKNPGNLNNEIGLPLTLLQLEEQHALVVLEMGMYALGEIKRLCDIARPRVGVVTNVGPSHLERLGSIERIAEAKAELVLSLPPEGVAVLNGDDERVRAMAGQTGAKVSLYGVKTGVDLSAESVESRGLDGIQFRLRRGERSSDVRLPLLGRHSVYTALAAAAVALEEGLSWEETVAGLEEPETPIRLVVLPGLKRTTIIDDTYNASPSSAEAALGVLGEVDARRIAVLGDMLELGEFEEEGHREVGRRAAACADVIIATGERGRIIGEEAQRAGMTKVYFADSAVGAAAWLDRLVREGDVVLVKGSRGMAMEKIVEGIAK